MTAHLLMLYFHWQAVSILKFMEQNVFSIVIYCRGHHWKDTQILYTSIVTLSQISSYTLSFFTITKCICDFIFIKKIDTTNVSFNFFLQNFNFFTFLELPSIELCKVPRYFPRRLIKTEHEKRSSLFCNDNFLPRWQ